MAESVGRTLIVSDLHLKGPRDPNLNRFQTFIEKRIAPCPDTTLVIAGDLVDFWFAVGPDIPEAYRQLVKRLEELHRVYWIEGNHDMGLERALGARRGGLRLLDGTLDLRCGPLSLSIAHGDQLDPGDLGHRLLRAGLRSPLARGLASWLGPRRTQALGQRVTGRRSSGSVTARSPSPRWLQSARSHANRRQAAEPTGLVVVGHGHHLGWWPEGLICLGDWIQFHSYLEVAPAQTSPLLRRFLPAAAEDLVLADRPLGDVRKVALQDG